MPIRSSDWVSVEYAFRILVISVLRQHIKYKLPQSWARIQLCMYIYAQVAEPGIDDDSYGGCPLRYIPQVEKWQGLGPSAHQKI